MTRAESYLALTTSRDSSLVEEIADSPVCVVIDNTISRAGIE